MTNNALKASTLRKHERLKSSSGITAVLRNGTRLHGDYISLNFTLSEKITFAVLVRKSVGTAVQRNKAKRWIREIYRQEKCNIRFPCNVIIILNKQFSLLNFTALKSDIEQLIQQLNKKIQ